MRCLDQVVGVVHASEDWHGLDGDYELGTLQIPVVFLTQSGQEGKYDTEADIIDEANQNHAQVPTKFMPVVMVKLQTNKVN